jgi:D-apionolactonase
LVVLYGAAGPEPEVRKLRAGPLSAELVAGNLRAICFDGVETLRAISYIIRNKDWGTYAPALSNLVIEEDADSFLVRYDARCVASGGAVLAFSAKISGRSNGALRFDAFARPVGDFLVVREQFLWR